MNEWYALTIDVAGEDETGEGAELREREPRRDSTAVTVLRVVPDDLDDALLGLPRYEVVDRHWWTGRSHADVYAAVLDLQRRWNAAYIVVDATGVGAGLASLLVRRLGRYRPRGGVAAAGGRALKGGAEPAGHGLAGAGRGGTRERLRGGGCVIPFEFTATSKSDLGWAFLALVETGRYKEYADDGAPDTAQFWREVQACEFEVLPGPGQRLRWGVRDPAVHDDLLMSAALAACLDGVEWHAPGESEVIPAQEDGSEQMSLW